MRPYNEKCLSCDIFDGRNSCAFSDFKFPIDCDCILPEGVFCVEAGFCMSPDRWAEIVLLG